MSHELSGSFCGEKKPNPALRSDHRATTASPFRDVFAPDLRGLLSEGEASQRAAVIEAASIHPNSFIGVPVEHTVYFPAESTDTRLPVRIRSNQPFRIEYHHPVTGDLLAVDNNGNGDFSDAGDFWTQAEDESNQVAAAIVERENDATFSSIEVWYFPNPESQGDALNLSVEVYKGDQWEVQAIDQIAIHHSDGRTE